MVKCQYGKSTNYVKCNYGNFTKGSVWKILSSGNSLKFQIDSSIRKILINTELEQASHI